MIERYLSGREELKLVLLVIDIRHAPSKDDVLMFNWLKHYGIRFCIVCTKADKIPKSQWDKHIKLVKETLGASKQDQVVLFSSETGNGREEVWSIIANAAGYEGEVLRRTPEL